MSDELITIATYPYAPQAHVARNYLEDQGIAAFVADEFFSTLNYAMLSAVKLQVAAGDVARASELLEAAELHAESDR